MIDHIHLLGTSRNLESMSRFISAYTSQYVKEFNRRTGRTGKLFEKEYGSAIKKEIKIIRSAIAYLFNNPVEKMLCAKAEEYRWNYLKYYGEFNMKPLRNCSYRLRKSIKIVQERFSKGEYLKYSLIDIIFKDLEKKEREYLTDWIIKLYFTFDVKKAVSYYRSYKDMLIAINSNTGSEHDIMEHSYCKTDTPYREMMVILKREGITDIRSVITWSDEDKKHIASLLKSRTSATHRQIRKFLHLKQ